MHLLAAIAGPIPLTLLLSVNAFGGNGTNILLLYVVSAIPFWPALGLLREIERFLPRMFRFGDLVPMAAVSIATVLVYVTVLDGVPNSVTRSFLFMTFLNSWGTFVGLVAYETIRGKRIRWTSRIS